MNAGDALRMTMPEHRGDERAPVAALRAEFLVAERAHQLGKQFGDLNHTEALLPRLERQRIAGQRWRHDCEMLGEQRNDLVKLEHRTGPAMREQQWRRVRLFARRVNEMQIDAADRSHELRK